MSRKLPPLNALKAFEASARLGSFVLAAAELNVSPSAISQHIKKLEDFYGRQLFIRHNNQLLLTDIARTVHAASSQMMNGLAELTEQLLGGPVRSNLIVSVLPSLAVRWLKDNPWFALGCEYSANLTLGSSGLLYQRDRAVPR